MAPLEAKLRIELRGSAMPAYELAHRLWPIIDYPAAWRTPSQGGPPSWVRTLGRAAKRYGLEVTIADGRKWVAAPQEWTSEKEGS